MTIVHTSCGNLHRSKVDITCNNGSKVTGSDHWFCGQDGEWTGSPSCGESKNTTANVNILQNITVATEAPQDEDNHIAMTKYGNLRFVYI